MLAWLCLYAFSLSGCKNTQPSSSPGAFDAQVFISPDTFNYEVNNPADAFFISGVCRTKGASQIQLTVQKNGYVYPAITCTNESFSAFLDASGVGFLSSGETANLILSTAGAPDVFINLKYNYCSSTRLAQSPFANSGEVGIDGTNLGTAYSICTATQFSQLAAVSSYWGNVFIVMNDLDFAIGGYSHVPVGNLTNKFTGKFYGNGHTLKNLTYSVASDYIGLFGYVGLGGLVTRVRLINVTVSGNLAVGSLVGYNTGTISRSMSSGSVTSTNLWAGGLVGNNNTAGIIEDCFSTAAVSSSSRIIGGLVGINSTGTVQRSYASGSSTSSGDGYQGSLVGYSVNTGNKVLNSFSIGNIVNSYTTPTASTIGHVVGMASISTLTNNHYSGACTANIICGTNATEHAATHFESAVNSPLDQWDFTNIWIEVPGGLPELR